LVTLSSWSITMEEQPGLFRTFNPLSPTTRQTTRALQEIQAQRLSGIFAIDEMRISSGAAGGGNNQVNAMLTPPAAGDNHARPVANNVLRPTNPQTHTNLNHMNILNIFNNLNNSPDLDNMPTNLTPLMPERRRLSGNFELSEHGNEQSPDEAVIQARGRRSIPLTYSPDINHTPLRQQMQRAKLAALSQAGGTNSRLLLPGGREGVRTSPRKRLTLNDTPPSSSIPSPSLGHLFHLSPEKAGKISPLTKKLKLDPTISGTSPEVAMKGLNQVQLTNLLSSLLDRHPDLREEVRQLMPTPDLAPLEERLNYLKRNIYKALPSTRLESKTDSMAFNRVSTHLATFKRTVVEQLKPLLEGEQWVGVLDYSVLAWGYVKATPVWENPTHNNTRKSCFRALAAASMTALRRGHFTGEQLAGIRVKMAKLQVDSDEVIVCLKYIDDMGQSKQ